MGLDTSHDCWHGAYSAFMRWRIAIAKAAGIDDLENWWATSGYPEEVVRGKWRIEPRDVIHVLLDHSDCDGVIPLRFCTPLANRLEELLPKLGEMGDGGWHIGYYDAKTRQFIDGLRAAAEEGEDVDFH